MNSLEADGAGDPSRFLGIPLLGQCAHLPAAAANGSRLQPSLRIALQRLELPHHRSTFSREQAEGWCWVQKARLPYLKVGQTLWNN